MNAFISGEKEYLNLSCLKHARGKQRVHDAMMDTKESREELGQLELEQQYL